MSKGGKPAYTFYYIFPMLFPLIAGSIIENWGYSLFFTVFAVVVLLSAFFYL